MALDEGEWMPWAVSTICCRVLYGKYVGWISISDGEERRADGESQR